MGNSRIKRERLLKLQPNCIFCGGENLATTIEHCPPRGMFDNRAWPEGFEFSSCSDCNHGTSDEDMLIAMMGRMDAFNDTGIEDPQLTGLVKRVHKQYPKLFQKMMPSAVEARRTNRTLGIPLKKGKTHQENCVVNVTDEMQSAVEIFSKKLSKAIYYLNSEKIFPNDGCLLLTWFTNAELVRPQGYLPFNLLRDIAGNTPPIQRSAKLLNSQFEYKISLTTDHQLFVIQAAFGRAFGIVVFGSTQAGQLEKIIQQLREESERERGPLQILQSSIF